jgi:hypothetical protein
MARLMQTSPVGTETLVKAASYVVQKLANPRVLSPLILEVDHYDALVESIQRAAGAKSASDAVEITREMTQHLLQFSPNRGHAYSKLVEMGSVLKPVRSGIIRRMEVQLLGSPRLEIYRQQADELERLVRRLRPVSPRGSGAASGAGAEGGYRIDLPLEISKGRPPEVSISQGRGVAGGTAGEVEHELGRGVSRGAAVTPSAELPDEFYADIKCPQVVLAGDPFTVVVALQASPPDDMERTQPIKRPAESFDLDVQLCASGFELLEGSANDFALHADREAPYPSKELRLRGKPLPAGWSKALLEINVLLSCRGQILGFVNRPLWLAENDEVASFIREDAESLTRIRKSGCSRPLDIQHSSGAPDVSIHIRAAGAEQWHWRLVSPHAGVSRQMPAAAFDLKELTRFAEALATRVEKDSGSSSFATVNEFSLKLAKIIPQEVKNAVKLAADRCADRHVSILFYSEFTQIPWEMTQVDEIWKLDRNAPGFLGAQARVGRWFDRDDAPRWPPATRTVVTQMTVICGTYNSRFWANLDHALQEGEELAKLVSANLLSATTAAEVREALKSDQSNQAFHLALHGRMSDPTMRSGLVLPPGGADDYLQPADVLADVNFEKHPFLFMNACQAASNYVLLDSASGLSEALLVRGAGALVAPLWKVDDAIAKDIALEVYQSIKKGTPVAEALRLQRAKFTREDAKAEYIAYQLYGHPDFELQLGGQVS